MKAARLYGKEDVRIDDIEEPQLQPGTVKIAPAYSGICGSDVHLYFDGPFRPAPSETAPHPVSGETLPVVLGHEFSGVVEEVADDVEGFKPGQSVVVEPFMVDGTCHACQRGDYHLCDNMGFIGISGRGGGIAEHIVVEKRWVHPIGDIPLDQAALIKPLSVSHHSIAHAGFANGDHTGEVAVIGGAGPIGLLAAAVLKAYGVKVIISEPSQARREKALETGVADLSVDPMNEDLAEKVREFTDGAMADVAFECTSVPTVLQQLIDVTRPGAHIEIIALHNRNFELDIVGDLTMPERSIGSSVGYNNDHPQVIKMIQDGRLDLAPYITSRIPMDDLVEKGYKALKEDPTEVKILIDVQGRS
ncbi:2,3-butanediol dehydrogenase [Corynebacterium sp. LK2590]|uniref:2,3-butanediol dehydrogenase n=1 Tax=unclassified Corynebacterium TaxID=2624378 RepID=UPI0034CE8F97